MGSEALRVIREGEMSEHWGSVKPPGTCEWICMQRPQATSVSSAESMLLRCVAFPWGIIWWYGVPAHPAVGCMQLNMAHAAQPTGHT